MARRSGFGIVIEEDRFEWFAREMHEAMGEAIKEIAKTAEYYAKTEHRYRNRTGNLERNIYAIPVAQSSGSGVAFEIGSYMFYAPYVEAWHAFLQPALEKALIGADDIIREHVRRRTS